MSSPLVQGTTYSGTRQSGADFAVADPSGDIGTDPVRITKADGLRGALGLFEVTVNGKTEYLTQQDLEQRNFNRCSSGASGPALFGAPPDKPGGKGPDAPGGGSLPDTGAVMAKRNVSHATPIASRTADQLRELAKWPAQAHAAWNRLTQLDRIAVFENMKTMYGEAFAKSFLEFTKSGSRQDGAYYGPHFPEHTPQWFAERGFKLAQRDSVLDWWVHPSGYAITADRDTSPWRPSPEKPANVPPPVDPPPVEPPVEPPRCADGDSAELLRMTRESLKEDVSENTDRQAEATAAKEKMDRMNVTSPEFKKAYEAYGEMLDQGKLRVEQQLEALDAARYALKEMCADTGDLDRAEAELLEHQTWFEVNRSLHDMDIRKPISVDVKDDVE